MELLDAYNRFLYRGQGRQIREMRMARQLSQREYADMIGVHICNLRRWESDQVTRSDSSCFSILTGYQLLDLFQC